MGAWGTDPHPDTDSLDALERRLIPALVLRCAQHLLKWGLEEEGLFRISGRASHVSKLRAEFDTGADYDISECTPGDLDPHAVSSVFKAYLRELPEPILTHALNPYFEAAMIAENNARRSEELARVEAAAAAGTSPPQMGGMRGPTLPSGPRAGMQPGGGGVVMGGIPTMRKPPSLSTLGLPNLSGIRPPSTSLVRHFASLIVRLPRENRDLLRTVVDLINETAKRAKGTNGEGGGGGTKMPLSNLTLVFCPSLNMSPGVLRVLCEVKEVWEPPVPPRGPVVEDDSDEEEEEEEVKQEDHHDAREEAVVFDNPNPFSSRSVVPVPTQMEASASSASEATTATTSSKDTSSDSFFSTSASPRPLTPASLSAGPVTPGSMSTRPLTPASMSSRPVTPGSMSARPTTPASLSPRPVTPASMATRPLSPESSVQTNPTSPRMMWSSSESLNTASTSVEGPAKKSPASSQFVGTAPLVPTARPKKGTAIARPRSKSGSDLLTLTSQVRNGGDEAHRQPSSQPSTPAFNLQTSANNSTTAAELETPDPNAATPATTTTSDTGSVVHSPKPAKLALQQPHISLPMPPGDDDRVVFPSTSSPASRPHSRLQIGVSTSDTRPSTAVFPSSWSVPQTPSTPSNRHSTHLLSVSTTTSSRSGGSDKVAPSPSGSTTSSNGGAGSLGRAMRMKKPSISALFGKKSISSLKTAGPSGSDKKGGIQISGPLELIGTAGQMSPSLSSPAGFGAGSSGGLSPSRHYGMMGMPMPEQYRQSRLSSPPVLDTPIDSTPFDFGEVLGSKEGETPTTPTATSSGRARSASASAHALFRPTSPVLSSPPFSRYHTPTTNSTNSSTETAIASTATLQLSAPTTESVPLPTSRKGSTARPHGPRPAPNQSQSGTRSPTLSLKSAPSSASYTSATYGRLSLWDDEGDDGKKKDEADDDWAKTVMKHLTEGAEAAGLGGGK
ncbi:RhoGAP-domain-containing protein [Stereum hirsutum FP-91666 SS1]|uniref:RhoGAP-domain-containing protein n=1 Tax=Stereum hirsutum (strain FP-91666) TaxID=721885 RepID=UPI000444A4AD|nr:RhoGAP-domain-containing protein [Stereum hirsutum FP-91666 SS1]EIM81090.1 RhoGAP-domain-containing protein [Stereum hirsutum FP-91666 SS1]